MAAVINTNIPSLNAQRNLTMSQTSLNTSLQRLSSGLRINSAKDDAAGLAISQRMTSQINGLTRAAQNANDGISLAQTAEGALGQVGDSLQRIRELAVQSANATNSSSDRAALQQEVSQLVSEITRIGDTTSFNGLKILDGTYTNQQYQIGANAGETINVSVADSRASQLGAHTVTSSGSTTGVDFTADLNINGVDIDTSGASSFASLVDAINAKSNLSGVTASRSTTNELNTGVFNGLDTDDTGQLVINGTSIDFNDINGADADAAIENINKFTAQTGVTASAGTGGSIVLTSANGADISLQDNSEAADTTNGATMLDDVPGLDGTGAAAPVDVTTATTFEAGLVLSTKVGGSLSATGALAGTLNLDATAANNASAVAAEPDDLQVSKLDISTVDGANKALATIDAALTQVSSTRAELGAIQNRFTAVVANLSTTSENLTASRSRIQDADFAAETANMTRGQILQQAGTAMLAQANSLPNGVLALLRG